MTGSMHSTHDTVAASATAVQGGSTALATDAHANGTKSDSNNSNNNNSNINDHMVASADGTAATEQEPEETFFDIPPDLTGSAAADIESTTAATGTRTDPDETSKTQNGSNGRSDAASDGADRPLLHLFKRPLRSKWILPTPKIAAHR